MQPDVINQLIELNRSFYHLLGEQFSATRQQLQPGVRRILETISDQATILDLGCGNGELARSLISTGFHGRYVGIDFSPVLIDQARRITSEAENIQFILADIINRSWRDRLAGEVGATTFELILAFAVLHHLPGEELRLQLAHEVQRLLMPGGVFIHSVWQFLNSERLRARIQPWQSIGLDISQVDHNDYLLDWRSGGMGLRYVHHFDAEELAQLARTAGFNIVETFESDGEGGHLGLYQKWVARSAISK